MDFGPLEGRLLRAVEFARGVDEMTRDERARALWFQVYPNLSEGKPGLLGAVIARAEAQVMRLACVYALLDESAVIRRKHLEAALAVWRYCEDSARFIFGEALGDPLADEIDRILKAAEKGLTRTEIYNHFGRNKESQRIGRALSLLEEYGLARSEKETLSQGRPAERWFSTRPRLASGSAHAGNALDAITTDPDRVTAYDAYSAFPAAPAVTEDGASEDVPGLATVCCECGSVDVFGVNRKDGRTYCRRHWRGNDADRIPPGAQEPER